MSLEIKEVIACIILPCRDRKKSQISIPSEYPSLATSKVASISIVIVLLIYDCPKGLSIDWFHGGLINTTDDRANLC